MAKIAVILLALLLAGCAKAPPPRLTKLPATYPYTAAERASINAERPKVKACCHYTDWAMTHYGKLLSKIEAAKTLEKGR